MNQVTDWVKVTVPVNKGRVRCECLWCKPLQDDQYRVANIPFYVNECSLDDIITAVEQDGRLVYKDTVVHARKTIRCCYDAEGLARKELQPRYDVFCRLCHDHEFKVEGMATGRLVVAVPFEREKCEAAIRSCASAARLNITTVE